MSSTDNLTRNTSAPQAPAPQAGAFDVVDARRLRLRARDGARRRSSSASWRAASAACSSRCTLGERTSDATPSLEDEAGAEIAQGVPGLALADALLTFGRRPRAAPARGVR